MVITNIAEGVVRGVESVGDLITSPFQPSALRIGVTGLSRAGKTVFITGLVANLLDRGRMQHLNAAAQGTISAAYLQPQPDDTLPRFDYESHLAAMTGPEPEWPESTRSISQLRLSLRIKPSGLLGGLTGVRTVHLDIVDYPGEWLLDLALLDKSYTTWATETLAHVAARPVATNYIKLAKSVDPSARLDEKNARSLAAAFTDYLNAARAEGFYDCTPGRFLLPGDLEGSPAITFAPIPVPQSKPRNSLWREMDRRFEAYKAQVVKPFFRDHFSKIDRQIVLVDALGAIHRGPQAVEDMRRAIADILSAFKPGKNAFLSEIFLGKRVEKILFAATKADHLHHKQHGKLSAIMDALVREAGDRARFAGAQTAAMSIAALRATVEETIDHKGDTLDCVRGALLETGKQAAFYPGDLPDDPKQLLSPARDGAEKWLDADYQIMSFAPAPSVLSPGDGPPHIRLDKAAEFLIGDRLL